MNFTFLQEYNPPIISSFELRIRSKAHHTSQVFVPVIRSHAQPSSYSKKIFSSCPIAIIRVQRQQTHQNPAFPHRQSTRQPSLRNRTRAIASTTLIRSRIDAIVKRKQDAPALRLFLVDVCRFRFCGLNIP